LMCCSHSSAITLLQFQDQTLGLSDVVTLGNSVVSGIRFTLYISFYPAISL
jgi:hypothetical protein